MGLSGIHRSVIGTVHYTDVWITATGDHELIQMLPPLIAFLGLIRIN
jgi:hypothetical protein